MRITEETVYQRIVNLQNEKGSLENVSHHRIATMLGMGSANTKFRKMLDALIAKQYLVIDNIVRSKRGVNYDLHINEKKPLGFSNLEQLPAVEGNDITDQITELQIAAKPIVESSNDTSKEEVVQHSQDINQYLESSDNEKYIVQQLPTVTDVINKIDNNPSNELELSSDVDQLFTLFGKIVSKVQSLTAENEMLKEKVAIYESNELRWSNKASSVMKELKEMGINL